MKRLSRSGAPWFFFLVLCRCGSAPESHYVDPQAVRDSPGSAASEYATSQVPEETPPLYSMNAAELEEELVQTRPGRRLPALDNIPTSGDLGC